MNKPRSMRVTIEESWTLVNPAESIKSAVINRHSDSTVILSVVKDLGRGDRGSMRGYKTIGSAKMAYLKDYQNPQKGCEKPEWKRLK